MQRRTWLALALVGGACACSDGAPPAAPTGRVVNITTATVERRSVDETEWAGGVIESLAAPSVSSEVAGRVVRILVDEGQAVSRGQVLAELDSQQYRLGQTVDQAEAGRLAALVRNRQAEYDRARRLQAENLISQEQLDSIRTDLEALREQLRGAEARAADSRRRLGEASIVAPFAGQIARRHVDVGALVQSGTVLFDIIDMENLRVRLPFPEARAAQLRPGLPVRLRSVAAQADETVTATITEVQPNVNPQSRSLAVIVDFRNPGSWRPGASVEAEVVLSTRPDALMIPQVALVRRPAGDVVYVIEEGRAREQPVRRGTRNGAWVEILAGLTGTETIALDGAGFLSNGAAVNVAGG